MATDISGSVRAAQKTSSDGGSTMTAAEAQKALSGLIARGKAPEALGNAIAAQSNRAADAVRSAASDASLHPQALADMQAQAALIGIMPLRNDNDRYDCANSARSLGDTAVREAERLYTRAVSMPAGPQRAALLVRARELNSAASDLVAAAEGRVETNPELAALKQTIAANRARFAD